MGSFSFAPSHGLEGWFGLVTAMFSHGNWDHLIGNYCFGLPSMLYLETKLGSKKFIEFFLLCGIGGSLLNLYAVGPSSCIGSSGALFGIFAGACMAFGDTVWEHRLGILFFLMSLLPQFMGIPLQLLGLTNVAVYAHIGGALTALILLPRLYKVDLCTQTHPSARPVTRS